MTWVYLISFAVKVGNKAIQDSTLPDTVITIHNGIPDTTVTIKSKSWYQK